MRLSKAQQNEIVVWKYFMPQDLRDIPITDLDLKTFFEWSEQGKHKDKINGGGLRENGDKVDGFSALVEGKRWAGIHMHEMYEEGVLDGSMPYFVILGGYDGLRKRKWWQFWKSNTEHYHVPIPREVVDFIKKEMFKGQHAEIIEKCYQRLLQ